MFERAQLSLTIVVVRRSSFSHRLHCLSLLFLKEYVGRSSGGGGVRVVGGGDSSTKKLRLSLLPCLIQAKPSAPGDAYEQAHHVRTGIGESWWWKRPWTPPDVAKSSPFF